MGSGQLDPELFHGWFGDLVAEVFGVFGPGWQRIVEDLERQVGHRCSWIGRREELRLAMRERFGLVGDAVVAMLFERAASEAYRLAENQRGVLLALLGAAEGAGGAT